VSGFRLARPGGDVPCDPEIHQIKRRLHVLDSRSAIGDDGVIVTNRCPYVWDYDITDEQFQELLDGELTLGRLDQEWAVVRLLEYAPYGEIVRRFGFRRLIGGWSRWRERIRSKSRKRGFDFLAEWLPRHHPELL